MRSKTQLLTLNGVIAAAYAALTLVASAMNLAYGPVQFRFSEALTVLPFLFPGTWPGLFVGCLVANLLSPYGPIDIVIGSLATLLAAIWTEKVDRPWLAPLPPVLCNMVLVGGMLAWYEVGFTAQFAALFAVNALWVGIGEAVVCYVLGLLLIRAVPERLVSAPLRAGVPAVDEKIGTSELISPPFLDKIKRAGPDARPGPAFLCLVRDYLVTLPCFSRARRTRRKVCSMSWPPQSTVILAYFS